MESDVNVLIFMIISVELSLDNDKMKSNSLCVLGHGLKIKSTGSSYHLWLRDFHDLRHYVSHTSVGDWGIELDTKLVQNDQNYLYGLSDIPDVNWRGAVLKYIFFLSFPPPPDILPSPKKGGHCVES